MAWWIERHRRLHRMGHRRTAQRFARGRRVYKKLRNRVVPLFSMRREVAHPDAQYALSTGSYFNTNRNGEAVPSAMPTIREADRARHEREEASAA